MPTTHYTDDAGNFVNVREVAEYFIQVQQDDGSWESDSSTSSPDIEVAFECLEVRRQRSPGLVQRVASATTTVIIGRDVETGEEDR
jgi:hypothetical protein